MSLFKRFLRGLSSYLFRLLILLLAVIGALVLTFHTPQNIEKSLTASGIYGSFVDNVISETKQANGGSSSFNNIPIDDPIVTTAAKKVFTPQLVQNSAQSLINGTYDWLNGRTKTPDFTIDLTAAKQTFAQDIGVAAAQKISNLGVCTLSQLRQLSPDINWYNLPCRPANLNIASQEAQVVSDVTASKDYLQNPVITYQNLPKDSQGQTIFDKFSKAPKYFRWFKLSPWIIGILAVISGGLTVWLSQPKRRGWRSLAYSLAGTAVLLVIGAFIAIWVLHRTANLNSLISSNVKASFQQSIEKVMNSIFIAIEHEIVWFAVAYAVISLAIWLGLYFTKPKTPTVLKANRDIIDQKSV